MPSLLDKALQVGAPCKILTVVGLVIIQCSCDAAPVITIYAGNGAMCPKCQRAFVISQIDFDLTKGLGINCKVDQIVKPIGA